MNVCPVCAYDKLEFPAANFTICACCGTEFGYDNRVLSFAALTERWVANQCPWFDLEEAKPFGWNGYEQLIKGGMTWAVPNFAAYKLEESVDVTSGKVNWNNPFMAELRAA